MITVRFEKEALRSAAYDNEVLIGKCEYEAAAGRWIIFHTETDPAYGGQGVARRLVECVEAAARSEGTDIVSTCSYARKVLGR